MTDPTKAWVVVCPDHDGPGQWKRWAFPFTGPDGPVRGCAEGKCAQLTERGKYCYLFLDDSPGGREPREVPGTREEFFPRPVA